MYAPRCRQSWALIRMGPQCEHLCWNWNRFVRGAAERDTRAVKRSIRPSLRHRLKLRGFLQYLCLCLMPRSKLCDLKPLILCRKLTFSDSRGIGNLKDMRFGKLVVLKTSGQFRNRVVNLCVSQQIVSYLCQFSFVLRLSEACVDDVLKRECIFGFGGIIRVDNQLIRHGDRLNVPLTGPPGCCEFFRIAFSGMNGMHGPLRDPGHRL